MKNVIANTRYWAAGTLAAFAGVGLARLVAPHLAPTARIACTVGGQLLALAGLIIISVGVSRRVRNHPASTPN
jgi:uncharacterized membrane protein YdcZ (DUF606 family)